MMMKTTDPTMNITGTVASTRCMMYRFTGYPFV
jgi:hypothetical protein